MLTIGERLYTASRAIHFHGGILLTQPDWAVIPPTDGRDFVDWLIVQGEKFLSHTMPQIPGPSPDRHSLMINAIDTHFTTSGQVIHGVNISLPIAEFLRTRRPTLDRNIRSQVTLLTTSCTTYSVR